MDVDDFVGRNLTEQADAFGQVADTMRTTLESLPDEQRAEIEQASAVLRTMRGGGSPAGNPTANLVAGRALLPLTVKATT